MSVNPVRVMDVQGVTVRYGEQIAVEDASFTIAKDEFVAILGPNGGGKTSLVRACLGLVPFDGHIEMLGDDTPPFRTARLHLAYVRQDAGHVDPMFPATALDVVRQGRLSENNQLGGYREQDMRAARDAMDRLGVLHLAKRRIGSLSGGERQRVMLARALAREPGLLILDEPFAAIDPSGRRDFAALLGNLKGMAVVVISHEPELLDTVARRFIYIDKTIRYDGRPKGLEEALRRA